ncbi:putative signal transducing protein [Pontibacter liquoris]|uniref:putative signal transducing protein n=1 Tax=Pontibacter liquoris TaxID=2905677 RepID=UPI001FA6CC7E|nr:DUF2007 domain-containing protein [Pontibacter liquoris]
MAERLITIATCNDPTQAHILKGRLAAEGILCFLGDEHIVAAQPFYAVAVGGIKLRVPENDEEEARAIMAGILGGSASFLLNDELELAPPMQEHAPEAHTCPTCGSDNIAEEKYNRAVFSLSYLFLGFPVPFLSHKYKCYNCSHRWRRK